MTITYDNRRFRALSNSDTGDVGMDTVFHYRQVGDLVWAEYSGGEIVRGNLIAICKADGVLDMRYQHVNTRGELMTGICTTAPEMMDGRPPTTTRNLAVDVRHSFDREVSSGGVLRSRPLLPNIQPFRTFFESVSCRSAKTTTKADKPFLEILRIRENSEMKLFIGLLVLTIGAAFGTPVSAQKTMMADNNPMVGGAAMYKTKDIVDNAVNSKDHTTLVAAVQAAGLVDTLKSAGPFTVFAPVNGAFAKLPAGTVDTLLKPENKSMLSGILTYHVVSGNMDSKAIAKAIKTGKGTATLTTVAGGKLTAKMQGKNLVLVDEKGGMSMVTIADVRQSNGVIHVVDTVLMPS